MGVVHINLPSYLEASLNQVSLCSFVHQRPRCVCLVPNAIFDCDIFHFCGAAGNLYMRRTAGAKLKGLWS